MYTDRKLLLGLLAILLSARKVTSISRTGRLLPRLRQQPLPILTRSTSPRTRNDLLNLLNTNPPLPQLLFAYLRSTSTLILRSFTLFGVLSFPFLQVRFVLGFMRFEGFGI